MRQRQESLALCGATWSPPCSARLRTESGDKACAYRGCAATVPLARTCSATGSATAAPKAAQGLGRQGLVRIVDAALGG
jgi:hypothetical protein